MKDRRGQHPITKLNASKYRARVSQEYSVRSRDMVHVNEYPEDLSNLENRFLRACNLGQG